MERDGAGATVEAVVEIPKGSRNKYEVDHATGIIRLRSGPLRLGPLPD